MTTEAILYLQTKELSRIIISSGWQGQIISPNFEISLIDNIGTLGLAYCSFIYKGDDLGNKETDTYSLTYSDNVAILNSTRNTKPGTVKATLAPNDKRASITYTRGVHQVTITSKK